MEVRMAARISRKCSVIATQFAKGDAEGTLEAPARLCTCAIPVGPASASWGVVSEERNRGGGLVEATKELWECR